MKRTVTLCILSLLILSLAACNTVPPADTSTDSTTTEAATTTTVTSSAAATDATTTPGSSASTSGTNGTTATTLPTTAQTTTATKAPTTTQKRLTADEIYKSLKRADRDCEEYDLDKYMQNLYAGNVVYNESFLPLENRDGTVEPIRLMYPVDKVLAIHDATLRYTYLEGKDFVVEDGCIVLTENSGIKAMAWDEYYMETANAYESKEFPGRYIRFREGTYYHQKQFVVSYIHTEEWKAFAPVNKADCLPKTYEKLKKGQPLNIVVTGSSTAVGGNNSALTNIAPHCPNWADMTAAYWEKTFGSDITLTNVGKGGAVATYGMTVMPETLAADPDLVIIVFGGNDSLHKVSVTKYINDLKAIMNAVQAQNPACEFIIVSGSLPSTEVVNYTGGLLKPYREELYKMEGNGIAIADLTAAHEALLQRKEYRDLTGNGIGHTNDFFTRIYAQFIGFMLTEEER